MAKTIVVLLLVAAAGYFVYQRIGRTPSDEEMLVTNLRERYAVQVNRFTSAVGRSGLIGMDSTYDTDGVIGQIKRIRAELAALRRQLTEAKAIREADALAERIEAFFRKNEITRP